MTSRRPRPVIYEPGYVSPSYHSRIWGRLIFALFVLGLFAGLGGLGALYWSLHRPQSASGKRVTVAVVSDESVATIANHLQHQRVINNPLLFRLDARLHNLGGTLKVGQYTLHRNMSIDQMIVALQQYHSPMIAVTVPEGYRLEQVAARLAHHGINGRQFLQAVRHPNFNFAILHGKPPRASLEGYLFPNTYFVPPHFGGRDFARTMVLQLGKAFTPAMRAQARREGLSVYQVLTLASIVEREAKAAVERPIIASVYLNRLHHHMGLYADPTIQYAVGTAKNWWPVLTAAQMQTRSPYNTYLHGGLPPGPIANPGLASIKAVIYPAKTNYYYFVARGHGRHVFEQTYAQHQRDIAKYEP